MDIYAILADSEKQFPDGSRILQTQIRQLKHNLNVAEGFTCEICKKKLSNIEQISNVT